MFKGAARVTYFELVENVTYLTTAIELGVSTAVRSTTWPETRARLAASLTPGDFATVATAYGKLTAIESAWARVLVSTAQGPDSIEATRDVLERVSSAALVLERIGWESEADRAALVAGLTEHVTLPARKE